MFYKCMKLRNEKRNKMNNKNLEEENKKNITSKLQKLVKNRKITNIITEKGSMKQKRLKNYFSDEEY
jgi:hypothetical protein